MQPIKNILTKLICLMFFINGLNLFAHTLQTPKGSQVEHEHPSDTGWGGHTAEWWTTWADNEWGSLFEERLERANKAYNCHAYAWAGSRQSQQSTWCWIGNDLYPPYQDENIYWTDGSYEEVSVSIATRANYGDYKDHSLELTSNMIEGQYEVRSKWGAYPLYRHKLYSDVYDAGPSDTKFYRIPPPLTVYISGPNQVVVGQRYTWTAHASYGTGSYSYQWYYRSYDTGYQWYIQGNDSTLSFTPYRDDVDLVFKMVVDDGNTEASDIYPVECEDCDPPEGGDDKRIVYWQEPLPESYALAQSHPNPFNPSTTLRYDLPEASNVSLVIYDIAGREVRSWNLQEPAGYLQVMWDGKYQNGQLAPTGLYIYRLVANSTESDQRFTAARKMVLMK